MERVGYAMINERSIELPGLLKFIQKHSANIGSLLDVGCALNEYSGDVSQLLKPSAVYDGCDLEYDPNVAHNMRKYYVCDLLELDTPAYDCVISISVLEHVGVKLYNTVYPLLAQYRLFKKAYDMAVQFVFFSFPFGCKGEYENEYSNITDEQLGMFLDITDGRAECRFFYSNNPPQGNPYCEVSREEASTIELNKSLGVQCVCLLGVDKCQEH